MNLYKIDAAISAAIEAMFDSMDEETGEVSEGSVAAFEELKESRTHKLEAIGIYIKNLTADVEALKTERDKLNNRIIAKENKIERLKEYVAESLKKSNDDKFETARVVYSFRRSEKLEIVDTKKIPQQYFKTRIDTTPDKTAIKKAIKNGEQIDGAKIVINQNLQIK